MAKICEINIFIFLLDIAIWALYYIWFSTFQHDGTITLPKPSKNIKISISQILAIGHLTFNSF